MADVDGPARRQELLDAMRLSPGAWPSGRVHRFYKANGWSADRTRARADLKRLVHEGHLIAVGPDNHRAYRLNPAADQRNGGWQTPATTANRVAHRPSRRR